jgi:hypothetical protein
MHGLTNLKLKKRGDVLPVNSLFPVTPVFNYFALISAFSSSPVRATSHRIYLTNWEWFVGLLVQESSLVFDRTVRMFCRCSIPTLSLFKIIIACFLQCFTNMKTEPIIDLFNNFRLRLAEHQSQLRTAWGIITCDMHKQWKLNSSLGGGGRLFQGNCLVCSIYIPFTFVYEKDEIYRSVYLCQLWCRC